MNRRKARSSNSLRAREGEAEGRCWKVSVLDVKGQAGHSKEEHDKLKVFTLSTKATIKFKRVIVKKPTKDIK